MSCENVDWICCIKMLVAGRLSNGVVECMTLVSSECLHQLRDCDTLTQYCGAWNCVGVRVAIGADITLSYSRFSSSILLYHDVW